MAGAAGFDPPFPISNLIVAIVSSDLDLARRVRRAIARALRCTEPLGSCLGAIAQLERHEFLRSRLYSTGSRI